MGGWRALLGPADVQYSVGKVHLRPFQVHKLGRAEAAAVSLEHHDGVALAPPIAFGRIKEQVDFGRRQIFTGSKLGVRQPARRLRNRDCPIFND